TVHGRLEMFHREIGRAFLIREAGGRKLLWSTDDEPISVDGGGCAGAEGDASQNRAASRVAEVVVELIDANALGADHRGNRLELCLQEGADAVEIGRSFVFAILISEGNLSAVCIDGALTLARRSGPRVGDAVQSPRAGKRVIAKGHVRLSGVVVGDAVAVAVPL